MIRLDRPSAADLFLDRRRFLDRSLPCLPVVPSFFVLYPPNAPSLLSAFYFSRTCFLVNYLLPLSICLSIPLPYLSLFPLVFLIFFLSFFHIVVFAFIFLSRLSVFVSIIHYLVFAFPVIFFCSAFLLSRILLSLLLSSLLSRTTPSMPSFASFHLSLSF